MNTGGEDLTLFEVDEIVNKIRDEVDVEAEIINGSIIIAVYFIFWVIVTVVLPIISIGLRLYSKESQIINDQAPDTLQDS